VEAVGSICTLVRQEEQREGVLCVCSYCVTLPALSTHPITENRKSKRGVRACGTYADNACADRRRK